MFPSLPALLQLAPKVTSQPFKRSQLGLFHGKMIQYGNNVPFSESKTRRRWLPNIQRKTFPSQALGRDIRVKVSTTALRTIRKYGDNIDRYLLHTDPELLGHEGMRLRILVREKWPEWQRESRRLQRAERRKEKNADAVAPPAPEAPSSTAATP